MSTLIIVLCVIIQSVALYSGMHIADERTQLACKAVMGGFNREIFDNYHIFVMDCGYGMSKAQKDKMKAGFELYLSVDAPGGEDVNLTGMEYSMVDDIDLTYITEGNGEYFTDQVVQYMKYKLGKDFVKNYLVKFGVIAGNKNILQAQKEQTKLVEESIEIYEDVMKLYSCVDGFKIKRNQPVYDSDGDLEFNKNFLKAVVKDNSSKEIMGYSDDLYRVRKNKSFCIIYKMNVLQKQLRRWIKAIDDNNSDTKKFCKKKCKSICDDLEEKLKISIDCCDDALSLIKKIEKDRKKYNEKKKDYDKYLSEHKDEVGKEAYDSLKFKEEESFVPDNLDELKHCIANNKEQLLQMKEALDFELKNDKKSLNHSLAVAELIIRYANDYSVEKLCFDYQNLEMECEKGSFLEGLRGIFEDGIISLVADEDKLSKKTIDAGGLVSAYNLKFSKSSIADVIEDALDSDITQLPANVCYAVKSLLSDADDLETLLLTATDELIDRILMNEYIMKCFNHYNVNDDDVNGNIKHSIDYEAEYIIAGNSTDRANIIAVVNRIIMFRTILNYLSIMTNKTKHIEAQGLALSVLGVAGVPVIVSVTTCIIEILWAYEEALVDCNALLKGYYVPVIKKGNQIKVGIHELLLMDKKMVNEKAKAYESNKNVLGMLDYKSYIELILLLTPQDRKAYRCMDLIQVNTNKTYGTNMRMKNGIYAVGLKTKFKVNTLFVNLYGMNKSTDMREYSSTGVFSY